MRVGLLIAVLLASAGMALAGGGSGTLGRAELRRACRSCHGLQAIEGRRFAREDWDRILDKMTNLGARIRNRRALLDYLSTRYGDK